MKCNIRFKSIEEVIHHFGIGCDNFDVLSIVVPVSTLDLIEYSEAVF